MCDLDLIFKVTAVEKLKTDGGETSVFSENSVTSYYYVLQKFMYLMQTVVDPDQMLHFVASDLGLLFVNYSLLRVSKLKYINKIHSSI